MLTLNWCSTLNLKTKPTEYLDKKEIHEGIWDAYPRIFTGKKQAGAYYFIHRMSRMIVIVVAEKQEDIPRLFLEQLKEVMKALKFPEALFQAYADLWGKEIIQSNGLSSNFVDFISYVNAVSIANKYLPHTPTEALRDSIRFTIGSYFKRETKKKAAQFWYDFALSVGIKCPVYTYYTFDIELLNVVPKVKRKITLPAWLTFKDFHEIIQALMGWKNIHLYEFRNNELVIEMPDSPYDPIETRGTRKDTVSFVSNEIKLEDVFNTKQLTINYIYDFGDYWQHEINVVKIIEDLNPFLLTKAEGLKGSCPPENCGGAPIYNELVKEFRRLGYSPFNPTFKFEPINPYYIKAQVNRIWEEMVMQFFKRN